MALASGNPALKMMDRVEHGAMDMPAMTVQGTVNKILILLGLAFLTATFTWGMFYRAGGIAGGGQTAVYPWLMAGIVGGLIFALVTAFKPNVAHITAPLYAMCQGLFLGAISAIIQAAIPNQPIVIQAAGLTFGTLAAMGIAYKTGAIKVTAKFRTGVMAATGAVMIVYLITFVLRMLNVPVPFIHQAGPIGIGISLIVIVIAALNLVLDFDFIERGAENNLPKQYEWYGAFGLMATLVWLYIEILRLLAIIASSRD